MFLNYYSRVYEFLLFAIIILNMYQRKLPHTNAKRKAPLFLAVDLLAIYLLLFIRSYKALPAFLDWVFLALGVGISIIFRKKFWPFRLHCSACGKKLAFNEVIGGDENFCATCFKESFPDEVKKKEETMSKEEILEKKLTDANSVDEIDWNNWEPTERCVLTYLFSDDKVLLIEKKKGMGSGYYNAPGGHIELEETKLEAAIRETKEETGLDVSDLEEVGTLYFQFKDGIRMLGYVFFAHSYKGEMIVECEETRPFWCNVDEMDYSMMWEDDKLWLPLALEGKHFDAYFIFDDRKMLDSKIVVEED